jgi:hypothetical protein
MIVEFKKKYIIDIANAQVLSWKVAFKGILSQKILSNLKIENFIENWKKYYFKQKEKILFG